MKRTDTFEIYIDRLRDGHVEHIDEALSPDFLDVCDEDLKFTDIVKIQGDAYLAEGELILHFALMAQGIFPCTICNDPVKVEVSVKDFYHVVPLAEIKGGKFNFRDIVREAILLEAPPFVECHGGSCPKRGEIEKYLKKPQQSGKDHPEERYHPFADL